MKVFTASALLDLNDSHHTNRVPIFPLSNHRPPVTLVSDIIARNMELTDNI
jgi:hypothetical protein